MGVVDIRIHVHLNRYQEAVHASLDFSLREMV
jgi:hypothetical protein